jgi:sporulation protein YlmC with PRC-barrel domain
MGRTSDQARFAWEQWRGQPAYDRTGDKIGTVEDVYDDAETGQPAWLAIKTGLFGMNRSFVPADKAEVQGDTLVLPYDKQQIKDAPNIAPDYQLTHDEERAMYEHYGLNYRPWTGTDYDRRSGDRDRDTVETETMTATSEEPVIEQRQRKVRLRKHRWVEQVPVQREEVRVEREPDDEITSSGRHRNR